MARPNMQTNQSSRTNVADRVTNKVTNALKGDKAFEAGTLALSAHIAGAASAAVLDLPLEARKELRKRQAELTQGINRLIKSFGNKSSLGKIKLTRPDGFESSKGEGLGAVVSEEEGQRLLDEIAVARKIEDWAGEAIGATELSRDYGIPRSTLHRWQHSNEVIALLKGTKKHVYPTEQFIDGHPAKGISTIIDLIGSHRIAWLWLRQSNPVLGGRKPIDCLKQDRLDEVVDVARAYFDPH